MTVPRLRPGCIVPPLPEVVHFLPQSAGQGAFLLTSMSSLPRVGGQVGPDGWVQSVGREESGRDTVCGRPGGQPDKLRRARAGRSLGQAIQFSRANQQP